jgi:hypothetical protein
MENTETLKPGIELPLGNIPSDHEYIELAALAMMRGYRVMLKNRSKGITTIRPKTLEQGLEQLEFTHEGVPMIHQELNILAHHDTAVKSGIQREEDAEKEEMSYANISAVDIKKIDINDSTYQTYIREYLKIEYPNGSEWGTVQEMLWDYIASIRPKSKMPGKNIRPNHFKNKKNRAIEFFDEIEKYATSLTNLTNYKVQYFTQAATERYVANSRRIQLPEIDPDTLWNDTIDQINDSNDNINTSRFDFGRLLKEAVKDQTININDAHYILFQYNMIARCPSLEISEVLYKVLIVSHKDRESMLNIIADSEELYNSYHLIDYLDLIGVNSKEYIEARYRIFKTADLLDTTQDLRSEMEYAQ